ncbi:MAG TPA: CDP-diacylglycerol--serine O-phosphatidyltransferase [bacterium]|nr:CDP-diacylglycerol--serine O-phosphatidyltransferase [bacterium]
MPIKKRSKSVRPRNVYITVPNLFTALNIFCGFLAVLQVLAEKYANACWLIFIATVFDALDGRIARASKNGSSAFGLQMDSLSDLVSSGVAPAVLVYQLHLKDLGYVGLILSFFPLLFAAFRLARFNVLTMAQGKSKDYTGLPAPAAAVTLAGLVMLYQEVQLQALLRMLVVMVPLVSLLMASTIRYDGFPRISLRERGVNRIKLAIIAVTLCLLPIVPHFVLFPFMFLFILHGLIRAAGAHLIGRQRSKAAAAGAPHPPQTPAHKTE